MRGALAGSARTRSWLLALSAAVPLADGETGAVSAAPPIAPAGRVQIESEARPADSTPSRATSQRGEPRRRRRHWRTHVDRLYLPSPAGTARIAADDHALAADPGTGGKNYDNDTNIDFGYDARPRHVFLRALLSDIPPKARILSATLQILARFGNAEPDCDVYVGLVPKDGLWDDVSLSPHWGQTPSFDGIVTARDAGAATLATTGLAAPGAANFGLQDTGGLFSLVSSVQVGQSMTITTAGMLADVQVRLRREGTLSGDTRIRVERCMADDGSDDRPDGVPLGVSAPVAASEIETSITGSLMTYPFPSGPSLELGGRYAFVLESDSIGSAANHLQWKIHHNDLYAPGGLVNYGLKIAWNIVAYPAANQLPFFFFEDLVTPRTPAFRTLTLIEDVPIFPAADAWVDVADLTTHLQEWVDGRHYVMNDVVAIQLFTAASTPAGTRRRGKDFRLQVTWMEPAGSCPCGAPNQPPILTPGQVHD